MSGNPVVVALHAHPDDESLLTGGTLATLAARGHRVVLVVATDGGRGLTGSGGVGLAVRRRDELDRAAAALGVARIVRLGYADSGDDGTAPDGFCGVPLDEVVDRVAAVVVDERAGLLIGYDRHGGYGHPDHRRVHAVSVAVAARTGTRLLMATVDRTWLERALRVVDRWGLLPAGTDVAAAGSWFSPREEITHRVRVVRSSGSKRRALACHTSQMSGGGTVRTVRLLARLPLPLFAVVAGTEWFIEPGAAVRRRPLRDPLVSAARTPS